MITNNKISIYFTLITLVLTVCFIIDLFLEMKIIDVFGYNLTTGIIIYPLVYIADDCMTEVYGYTKARLVMWLTFFISFICVSILQITVLLPSPEWFDATYYNKVFDMTPRILLASMFGLIASSSLNSYVLSKMKVYFRGKFLKLRIWLSSLFGRIIDALIFFPLAYFGIASVYEMFEMAIIPLVFALCFEAIILPLTTKIIQYVKIHDNTDVYDININYNPFNFEG